MTSYIYPANAAVDEEGNVDEWVRGTLNIWEESRKPYLCFPYARNQNKKSCPKYLIDHADGRPFWLYMYYLKPFVGKNFAMGGQVKFRIHVVGTRNKNYKLPPPNQGIYNSSNVYCIPGFDNMEVTLRLICDKFEEICLPNCNPVCIDHFRHPENKNLPSLMENQYVGITPVVCTKEFNIIRHYPHDERKDGPAKCCRLCK